MFNKVIQRSYYSFLKFSYLFFEEPLFLQLCQKLQTLVKKIKKIKELKQMYQDWIKWVL
jgi:hypothetical protein